MASKNLGKRQTTLAKDEDSDSDSDFIVKKGKIT